MALSYTWGSNEKTGTTLVNGKSFSVTKNLGHALGSVFPLLEEHDMYLWVDAICINQEDLDEKAIQIGLMKLIYDNASEVVAWLGPESKHSEKAMEALSELYALSEEYWKTNNMTAAEYVFKGHDIILANSRGLLEEDEDDQEDNIPGDIEIPVIDGLADFLQSLWWGRTWIIQEATGPQTPVLFIGNIGIPWRVAVAFSMFLAKATEFPQFDYLRLLHNGYQSRLENLRITRKDAGGEVKLLKLLDTFRTFDATDPRDKVFALLALSCDFKDSIHLVPNYRMSVEDTFLNTAVKVIEQEKDNLRKLDILGCCSGRSRGNGLPSWVPDWRPAGCPSRLPFVKTLQMEIEGRSMTYPAYNAGRYDEAPTINITGRTLQVRGFVVDIIKTVSKPNIGTSIDGVNDEDFTFELQWVNPFGTLKELSASDKKYFTGEPFLGAFMKTVVADMLWEKGKASRRGNGMRWFGMGKRATMHPNIGTFETDEEILASMIAEMTTEQSEGRKATSPTGDVASTLRAAMPRQTANDVMRSMRSATIGRRFVTTQSHGWMGIAPAEAEEGDVVLCVIGAPVFYILRLTDFAPDSGPTVDRDFELIGEAYFHGCMDGEVSVPKEHIHMFSIV